MKTIKLKIFGLSKKYPIMLLAKRNKYESSSYLIIITLCDFFILHIGHNKPDNSICFKQLKCNDTLHLQWEGQDILSVHLISSRQSKHCSIIDFYLE